MKSRKHYTKDEVLKSLSKKHGLQVYANGLIEVLENQNDCGNSTWGKIDYLCNYHNYTQVFVRKF